MIRAVRQAGAGHRLPDRPGNLLQDGPLHGLHDAAPDCHAARSGHVTTMCPKTAYRQDPYTVTQYVPEKCTKQVPYTVTRTIRECAVQAGPLHGLPDGAADLRRSACR